MTPAMRRALGLALLAGLGWGLWAALANAPHGPAAALRAGAVQAAASFAATFGSSRVLEWLLGLPRRPLARFALASFGTQALVLAGLVAAHALLGTPEIARTLLPVAALGLLYFPGYAAALLRAEAARADLAAARSSGRRAATGQAKRPVLAGSGWNWPRLLRATRGEALAPDEPGVK